MLQRLEEGGFLQARALSHGGTVVELTAAGHKASQNSAVLDQLFAPPETPVQPTLTGEVVAVPEVDAALLEALTQWRLASAKARKVPAYAIFSNQTLEAIAQHRPTTLAALEKVKGIGPAKIGQYGETVVELVREHLADSE